MWAWLRTLRRRWLCGARYEGGWWFRVCGWGISARHRMHDPLFSERNGYRKVWPKYPARWRFELLRPKPLDRVVRLADRAAKRRQERGE